MKIKKIVVIMLLFLCLLTMQVNAKQVVVNSMEIEYLEDGSYFETLISSDISVNTRASSSTRSGSKTINYKNSSGEVMWYVTANGTYSYKVGKSSTCTVSTVSSGSKSSSWKVSSPSSSKSGNKATATATGTLYTGSIAVNSYKKTVTLSCDSNGNLS